MKKLLLALVAILFAINVYAQPNTITYQGVLTDNSGALITGTPNITFALYSTSTGGTALWTETQNAVSVTNGLFQVELNSVNADWGTANFSGSMWLQITVVSTILTPRIAFTAGGYSLAGKATSLQIASGAGAGKVLTSDANGNGSWQTASTGLSNFTESNYLFNTKTGVKLLASNDATNVDVVLQPKGTGAILAQQPDGNATGGNNRGLNVVDLQTSRNANSQVASGNYSFIGGGQNNTANATWSSIAGGYSNIASGENSIYGGVYNIAQFYAEEVFG